MIIQGIISLAIVCTMFYSIYINNLQIFLISAVIGLLWGIIVRILNKFSDISAEERFIRGDRRSWKNGRRF